MLDSLTVSSLCGDGKRLVFYPFCILRTLTFYTDQEEEEVVQEVRRCTLFRTGQRIGHHDSNSSPGYFRCREARSGSEGGRGRGVNFIPSLHFMTQ